MGDGKMTLRDSHGDSDSGPPPLPKTTSKVWKFTNVWKCSYFFFVFLTFPQQLNILEKWQVPLQNRINLKSPIMSAGKLANTIFIYIYFGDGSECGGAGNAYNSFIQPQVIVRI